MSCPLIFRVLILALLLTTAPGCGGGSSGGSGSSTRTAIPRVTIHWPARSRATNSFSSALSVIIRMKAASVRNQDIVLTVDRANNATEYTETYLSNTDAKVGSWRLEAEFHAERGGAGAVVGTAAGQIAMDAQGNVPDIATQGAIAQVEIQSGQSILVGQQTDLTFRATAANGDLIALTAGSLQYTVSAGADKARFSGGYVEGIAPGNATLVPSVDGITGPPQVVKITSNATVDVTPNPITLGPGGTVTFQATVTNAPNTAVIWSVDEGAAGGTITANGVYTAPNANGVYHARATCVYDPDKWHSIVITVEGGGAEVGVDFPPSGGADVIVD